MFPPVYFACSGELRELFGSVNPKVNQPTRGQRFGNVCCAEHDIFCGFSFHRFECCMPGCSTVCRRKRLTGGWRLFVRNPCCVLRCSFVVVNMVVLLTVACPSDLSVLRYNLIPPHLLGK